MRIGTEDWSGLDDDAALDAEEDDAILDPGIPEPGASRPPVWCHVQGQILDDVQLSTMWHECSRMGNTCFDKVILRDTCSSSGFGVTRSYQNC